MQCRSGLAVYRCLAISSYEQYSVDKH